MLRVTEILAEAGMVDYRFSNEDAKTRGTYVHTATEMIDRHTLDWETLDDTLRPYCVAYLNFLRDTGYPAVVLSEKRMDHPQYQYTGQVDRIFNFGNSLALVDLKTGSPHPAVDLQVAAYRELVKECEGLNAAPKVLYLHDDETYRLVESKDYRRNFNIFLAALSVVRWKKENL